MTGAALLRIFLAIIALALLGAGLVLAYISLIALRRNEGVFLPAGYVAVACLAAGGYVIRWLLRS